jgi:Fe-S cluster biogenesis protein NfuA/nitrite reductase/ring-hydroxylating ferredoxin subunit
MTTATTTAEQTLDTLAERVDKTIAEVNKLAEAERKKALDLKEAIEAFHKAGLTRIVQTLKADPRGKELLFALIDEPEVYALFTMHGIVRPSLPTRVAQVIDRVRPYMQSHGGDVELVEVQPDTVYIRLLGACNGCSMSAVTLREGVEEALREHVPEIQKIEVVETDPVPALIRFDDIPTLPHQENGWIQGPPVDAVKDGEAYRLDSDSTSILIIRLDQKLMAYRNQCAHQALPLDGGLIDRLNGTLTCPFHGFCYDARSGECLSAPQAQLEAFPLRIQDGIIWIRPIS